MDAGTVVGIFSACAAIVTSALTYLATNRRLTAELASKADTEYADTLAKRLNFAEEDLVKANSEIDKLKAANKVCEDARRQDQKQIVELLIENNKLRTSQE